MPGIKLAPSILTADVGRLAEQVREAADGGADYIHLDVMDGSFVPVVRLRGWTRGVALTDGVAFVGTSRVIPRFHRYAPGSGRGCGIH